MLEPRNNWKHWTRCSRITTYKSTEDLSFIAARDRDEIATILPAPVVSTIPRVETVTGGRRGIVTVRWAGLPLSIWDTIWHCGGTSLMLNIYFCRTGPFSGTGAQEGFGKMWDKGKSSCLLCLLSLMKARCWSYCNVSLTIKTLG